MSQPVTIVDLCDAYLDSQEPNFQTSHETKQAKRAFYAGFRSAFEVFRKSAATLSEDEGVDLLCQLQEQLDAFEARKKAGQE